MRFKHPTVQTKLKIGQENDRYEQEADTMADQVIRMPQSEPPIQRKCEHCEEEQVQMKPSKVKEPMIQRKVNYIKQVKGKKCEDYLKDADESILKLEKYINGAPDDAAGIKDLRAALKLLKNFRANDRIECWHTSGGLHYASYDGLNNIIKLHVNHHQAVFPNVLIHEAIHALHGKRFPRATKEYGRYLKKGGIKDTKRNQPKIKRLLNFIAWTEYWSYRRGTEYDNLRQDPEFKEKDPGRRARGEEGVKGHVTRARKRDKDFDPETWKPKK